MFLYETQICLRMLASLSFVLHLMYLFTFVDDMLIYAQIESEMNQKGKTNLKVSNERSW